MLSKLFMIGIISLIFIFLSCLSQMIDWDEYTPANKCKDFLEWISFNHNTLEFQMLRLIFIIVLSFVVSILVNKYNI